MGGIFTSIRCPYCCKKMNSVKSIYGHWAHCQDYKYFIEAYGRENRVAFSWVGYRARIPKGCVDQGKAPQKPVGKPNVENKEIKKG